MRSWLPFAAKAVGLMLIFALVAPVILPFYSGLQIGLVRPFVSPEFALRLQPDGSIYIYYKNHPNAAVRREVTSFSGLGLMLALFLAMPFPWRRRLARLGLGILVLLGFHLIALWGLIAIWNAMFKGGDISFSMRWAYMLIASGDWLAPLVSWGLLGFSQRGSAPQRTHLGKGGGLYASV